MNLVHTGKTETIKADLVLLAMGFTNPIPEGVIDALGLEKDPRGNVKVNEKGSRAILKCLLQVTCRPVHHSL